MSRRWWIFKNRVSAIVDFPTDFIEVLWLAHKWRKQNIPAQDRTWIAAGTFFVMVFKGEINKFRLEWNLHLLLDHLAQLQHDLEAEYQASLPK